MFGPKLAQVNELGVTTVVFIPQASVAESTTSEGEIEAVPVALNSTGAIIALIVTTGAILSTTVTTVSTVETLPFTSVTVNVTTLFPTFTHEKVSGVTTIESIVQLSVEPLSISSERSVALPSVSNVTTTPTLAIATGF